jgi:hypothetical protein
MSLTIIIVVLLKYIFSKKTKKDIVEKVKEKNKKHTEFNIYWGCMIIIVVFLLFFFMIIFPALI